MVCLCPIGLSYILSFGFVILNMFYKDTLCLPPIHLQPQSFKGLQGMKGFFGENSS